MLLAGKIDPLLYRQVYSLLVQLTQLGLLTQSFDYLSDVDFYNSIKCSHFTWNVQRGDSFSPLAFLQEAVLGAAFQIVSKSSMLSKICSQFQGGYSLNISDKTTCKEFADMIHLIVNNSYRLKSRANLKKYSDMCESRFFRQCVGDLLFNDIFAKTTFLIFPMLISRSSHPKNLFFIIRISAASSIRRALYSACSIKQVILQYLNQIPRKFNLPYPISAPIYQYHPNLNDVKNYLGDQYDDYYVFTFVRHPISIQLSLYKYMRSNRRHRQYNLIKKLSFDEYMDWRINQKSGLISDFHYSLGGSLLVADFFKLENINDQFSDLMFNLSF